MGFTTPKIATGIYYHGFVIDHDDGVIKRTILSRRSAYVEQVSKEVNRDKEWFSLSKIRVIDPSKKALESLIITENKESIKASLEKVYAYYQYSDITTRQKFLAAYPTGEQFLESCLSVFDKDRKKVMDFLNFCYKKFPGTYYPPEDPQYGLDWIENKEITGTEEFDLSRTERVCCTLLDKDKKNVGVLSWSTIFNITDPEVFLFFRQDLENGDCDPLVQRENRLYEEYRQRFKEQEIEKHAKVLAELKERELEVLSALDFMIESE